MTVIEHIGAIAEAVLPLMTLCCGLLLGLDLADWLAARWNRKKGLKQDNDKEDERK